MVVSPVILNDFSKPANAHLEVPNVLALTPLPAAGVRDVLR